MKMPGRCTGPKFLSKSLGTWRRRHLGGHDFVRRMDRQGEALIWCRKCSGNARKRMEPKLMNCCRMEQMGTKEFGKVMKRIQTLEERRVPAKETKNCPDRTLQTPLPQQSSSSAREEEGRWVLMEDRRRRGIAFEKLASEMLR